MLVVWHGDLASEFGNDTEARLCYQETLRISRQANIPDGTLAALRSVALHEADRGRPLAAIHLLAAADRAGGSKLDIPPEHLARRSRNPALLRAAIGDPAFTAAWAFGETMSLEQAGDYALSLLAAPS